MNNNINKDNKTVLKTKKDPQKEKEWEKDREKPRKWEKENPKTDPDPNKIRKAKK